MPSFKTLAELILINDQNLADREISDLLDDAPFMRALAADIASNGTKHSYVKETGAPVVGFRAPNAGRLNSKSTDTSVTIDLKILDASFLVDKALAEAYRLGPDAYVAREAVRHLKAAFFGAEKQFINGTGSDEDGFTGLADALDFEHAMSLDAGGSTANTGSSVYLVRTNDDMNDCVAITGREGELEIGETVVQRVETSTPDEGASYTGLYTPIEGWIGLQIGGLHSVARIFNLTEDAGKTLTDDLIYRALELFPAARQPNLIVMNRRSQRQLRESRTATNATGAPAPRPTEVDGIPIVTTDAISKTEAILTSD